MIGERLADLRKDKGWTQKQLAELLGVKWHSISYYERGKIEPGDVMKIKIAKLFGVSSDYLLGLTNMESPYRQDNVVVLPKGCTKQYEAELLDYMNYLNEKHRLKKKPTS